MLFGNESVWSKAGYSDLKQLSEKLKKHECSVKHINNQVKPKLLGNVNIIVQILEEHIIVILKKTISQDKKKSPMLRIGELITSIR